MKVIVATKNPGKIEGVRKALEYYYEDIDVIGIPSSSDVSNQPVNEEIMLGAKNRVANLKKYCCENNIDADLYISVEEGITNSLGEWLVLSVAIIEDDKGFISWGTSSGFPVPNKHVNNIIERELGPVMNEIFSAEDLRSGNGGISLLTDGAVTRIEMVESSVIMALIQYRKDNIWSDKKTLK